MAEHYKISGERLTAIADQARRLGNVSGELTLEQMEYTLKGVTDGGGETLPIAEDTTFGYVKKTETVTEKAPEGKCWYNGVLLPAIPADVLAEYPYCWIRENHDSGYYELVFCTQNSWYQSNTSSIYPTDISKPIYHIEIEKVETTTSWAYSKDVVASMALNANRSVLWSNHDIPNGSATATEIYFKGSELLTELTETVTKHVPVERESNYSITNDSLNEIARRTQEMAGTNKLMTPEEIIYWLDRVKFIPQGWANSMLVLPTFESGTTGINPVVVKGVANSMLVLPTFESGAVGALQEG